MTLKIVSGALDEMTDGEIVLRGVIDPASLDGLLTPLYQREELRDATIEKLVKALRNRKRFPDVDLAVRGDHYGCTDDRKGTYTITGSVYIVDGLQRTTAARRVLREGGHPLLGTMVHFATTEDWERGRFLDLNQNQKRVSPNVVLRDHAADYAVLKRLHQLCSDESFVLCERISWQQFMRREELLTAVTFLKTAMRLHGRFGAGRHPGITNMCEALAPMAANVGTTTMVENVKTFFDLLDSAWGIRGILHKDRATHLRVGFLSALADVFSEYDVFWNGKTLRIDRELRKKIGQFPLREPNIDAMARSGAGATSSLLRRLIVDHINSGKRTRRLDKPDPYRGGMRVAV